MIDKIPKKTKNTVDGIAAVAFYWRKEPCPVSVAMPQMPKRKPAKKVRWAQAKLYARVLQLARVIVAYDDSLNIGELVSESVIPVLLKRIKELGVPVPADPDDPLSKS